MTAEWITEKAKNFGLASFKSWNLMDGYATTVAASKSQDIASLSATPGARLKESVTTGN